MGAFGALVWQSQPRIVIPSEVEESLEASLGRSKTMNYNFSIYWRLTFTQRATTAAPDELSLSCSERFRHQLQW
jgi:hypothetical protein